jgi:hypothetical protein
LEFSGGLRRSNPAGGLTSSIVRKISQGGNRRSEGGLLDKKSAANGGA